MRNFFPPLRSGRRGTILVVVGILFTGAAITAARWLIGPVMAGYEPLPGLTRFYYAMPIWLYPLEAAALLVVAIAKDRFLKGPDRIYLANLLLLAVIVFSMMLMVIAAVWAIFAYADRAVG